VGLRGHARAGAPAGIMLPTVIGAMPMRAAGATDRFGVTVG
jgi:hypothetical protein